MSRKIIRDRIKELDHLIKDAIKKEDKQAIGENAIRMDECEVILRRFRKR